MLAVSEIGADKAANIVDYWNIEIVAKVFIPMGRYPY